MWFRIDATSDSDLKTCIPYQDKLSSFNVMKMWHPYVPCDDEPCFFEIMYIEINTLEELIRLNGAVRHALIFEENWIEIYDDCRE